MILGGKTVFPITLGNGPPLRGKDPVTGADGWAEVAAAGVKMLRVYPKWETANASLLLQETQTELTAAASHGLRLWVGLFNIAEDLSKQPLLEQIIDGLKDSPGLGAWKGADEPLHGNVAAHGLIDAYNLVRERDPNHPLVLIQAPQARDAPLTADLLKPYADAADIHGVDIYPISHPPGTHADRPNKDISVVGDVTELVVEAAPDKEPGRPCRSPGAASSRQNTYRSSRPCTRNASWPIRRSSRAPKDSSSSAATSLRC